jgi:hypothetical protein
MIIPKPAPAQPWLTRIQHEEPSSFFPRDPRELDAHTTELVRVDLLAPGAPPPARSERSAQRLRRLHRRPVGHLRVREERPTRHAPLVAGVPSIENSATMSFCSAPSSALGWLSMKKPCPATDQSCSYRTIRSACPRASTGDAAPRAPSRTSARSAPPPCRRRPGCRRPSPLHEKRPGIIIILLVLILRRRRARRLPEELKRGVPEIVVPERMRAGSNLLGDPHLRHELLLGGQARVVHEMNRRRRARLGRLQFVAQHKLDPFASLSGTRTRCPPPRAAGS